MTAKKRWVYNKSDTLKCNNTFTQPDIIWTSSSSEDEEQTKKFKGKDGAVAKKWIKLENIKRVRKKNYSDDLISELPDVHSESPSKFNNHCFAESPIIGTLSSEMSPIISQNCEDSNLETSPVLGKRKLYKIKSKIKKKIADKHDEECKIIQNVNKEENIKDNEIHSESKNGIHITIEENSPDLFGTQTSFGVSQLTIATQKSMDFVISQTSTIASTNTEAFVIETTQSQNTQKYSILPYPSQEKSEVQLDETEVTTDHLLTKFVDNSARQTSSERKKKYKRNGLAWQLQKALQSQKTKLAIWKHELYLSKVNNTQFITREEELQTIMLIIRKIKNEFSSYILECDNFEEKSNIIKTRTPNLPLDKRRENDCKCLVIIGSDYSCNINLDIGNKFKIYPPYITKELNYCGKFLKCYINVSKLLYCK